MGILFGVFEWRRRQWFAVVRFEQKNVASNTWFGIFCIPYSVALCMRGDKIIWINGSLGSVFVPLPACFLFLPR